MSRASAPGRSGPRPTPSSCRATARASAWPSSRPWPADCRALITTACHFPELAAAQAAVVVSPDVDAVTRGCATCSNARPTSEPRLGQNGRQLVEATTPGTARPSGWPPSTTGFQAAGRPRSPSFVDGRARPFLAHVIDPTREDVHANRFRADIHRKTATDDANARHGQSTGQRDRAGQERGREPRRCLPALAWADEVFVVDSQSTDEPRRSPRASGATVVQFHFNGTYPKKKNWALENLPFRNEWVLIVDADEVVVPELAGEIAGGSAATRPTDST